MSLQWYALPSKLKNEGPLWREVPALGPDALQLQSGGPLSAHGSPKPYPHFPGYTLTDMDLLEGSTQAFLQKACSERLGLVLPPLPEKRLVLRVMLAG